MAVVKVIVTIITVLSTIFNTGALFNLFEKRPKSNYIFLCINLTSAGLIQTLFGYLPSLFLEESIKYGSRLCQISAFFVAFPAYTSIALLTTINVVKALSLRDQFLISDVVYRKWVKLSILCCWIYGLFWSSLPLIGVSTYTLESTQSRCSIKWHTETPTEKVYLVLVLVFCYVVPIFIILFSAIASARFVHANFKLSSCALGLKESSIKILQLRESKVKLLLSLRCWSFIIFWTPYAVVGLLSGLAGIIHANWLLETAAMFAKLSAMVNPLLYWQKEDLKKKVLKVLFRK